MNPPHILGRFRLPIVHVLASLMGVLSLFSSWNIFLAIIHGGIAWGIFWLLTTEVMLKVSMSGIVGGATGGVACGFFYLAGFKDGGSLIALFLFGIGAWIWAYIKLDKSSWIGTPCPHCFVRGKTDKEEINRQYLGQKTEKSGDKYVTYNLYQVTYRNWCNSCAVDWQSTGETRDRA